MDAMKKQLLKVLKDLRKEGIFIENTPPLFRWSYPEEPDVLFELLITSIPDEDAESMPENEVTFEEKPVIH